MEPFNDGLESRVTAQQETQTKLDLNYPNGIVYDFSNLPFAEEETLRA